MKAKEQFNPDLDAELTFIPSFQETPFVVTGLGESLLPIAEAVQAAEAAPSPKRRNVASVAVEAVRTAPEAPQALYVEPSRRERIAQYFADAKLRRFDKVWNTDLYAEKQVQRRKTAIFLMASEAELFDESSDYYKAQLRRFAK